MWCKPCYLLIGLFFLLFVSTKSQALTFFYSEFPPLEYQNKQGQPDGDIIAAVNKVFEQANSEVSFNYQSLARGLKLINQGSIDFVAVIHPDKSIHQDYYVIDEPFHIINLVALRLTDTEKITNLGDLASRRFAILNDASFFFLVKQYPDVFGSDVAYKASNFLAATRMLENSRIDHFLTYDSQGEELSDSAFGYDLLASLPVHFMVAKSHPNARAVVESLNRVMAGQSANPLKPAKNAFQK